MSFRKAFATMESTDNSRIYRLARRYLYTSCSFCRPHLGDNSSHKYQRNWKKTSKRNHQWKGNLVYAKTQHGYEDRKWRNYGDGQVDGSKDNVVLSLGSLIDWYRDWSPNKLNN